MARGNKLMGSPEYQARLKGRGKPVYQFDLNDHIVGEFHSPKHASEAIKADSSGISRCCLNNRVKRQFFFMGYKWQYIRDAERQMQIKRGIYA